MFKQPFGKIWRLHPRIQPQGCSVRVSMSVSVGGGCGVGWLMVYPPLLVAQGVEPVAVAVSLQAAPPEVHWGQLYPTALNNGISVWVRIGDGMGFGVWVTATKKMSANCWMSPILWVLKR